MPIESFDPTVEIADVEGLDLDLSTIEDLSLSIQGETAANAAGVATKQDSSATLSSIRQLSESGVLVRNPDGDVVVYARPVAQQQGSIMAWGEYQQAKQELIRDNRRGPLTSAIGWFMGGHGIAFSSAYYSATLMRSGMVYFVPYAATQALAYDPRTDKFWTPGGTFNSTTAGGGGTYTYGVNLPDGRLLLIPYDADRFAIYDPHANTTTFQTDLSMLGDPAYRYRMAVLLNDSEVFCVPQDAGTAIVYNFLTQGMTFVYAETFGNSEMRSACRLPDGRIFIVPYLGSTARIYDPAINVYGYSTPSGTYTDSHLCCLVMADGRVFIAPWSETVGRIYDPVADTLSNTIDLAPVDRVDSCLEMPDGRIFMQSYAGPDCWYDPHTSTTGVFPWGAGNPYSGACLLPNGDILKVPWVSNLNPMIVRTRDQNLDIALLLSQYGKALK